MILQRNKIIPAVFLLLQKDNNVLLQRRYNTGFQDGKYTLISGHVEKGEPPMKAVCREAKEEAGIIVKEKDLTFLHVLYRRSFDNTKATFNFAP